MKKTLLICSSLFFIGCESGEKDCNCTQQRWERKAIYKVNEDTSAPPISATEWEKKGTVLPADNDCSKDGSIPKSGSIFLSSNSATNTYTNLEYEYRVTCQ